MTRRFGDRATFAVEVGERTSPELRVVDLWAASKLLTTDDNVAFLPHFRRALRATAAEVRGGSVPPCPYPGRTPEDVYRLLQADGTEFREQFWFMRWGPTVDNVLPYAYLDGDLVIVFEFWRAAHPALTDLGKIFVARIPPGELATTLDDAADLLDARDAR